MNKTNLDEYQLQYLTAAEKLQSELIGQGFMASRVMKGEDRTDFSVVFFNGTHEYRIARNYLGNITVSRIGTKNDRQVHRNYPHVSNSNRSAVHQKYAGQNMKVLTAKKFQAKLDAEDAYHEEMQQREDEAVQKYEDFVAEVQAAEKKGLVLNWRRDRDTQEINGGRIERNGVEFAFDFGQDGYIGHEMRISYIPETSLKNFMLISDNKYKPVKE